MSTGFSSDFSQDLSLNGLTREQFLIISIETAKSLSWNISYLSANGFIAYPLFSRSMYSEEVKLIIDENDAVIKSERVSKEEVNWQERSRNIDAFLSLFEEIRLEISPEEIIQRYEDLKEGFAPDGEKILSRTTSHYRSRIAEALAVLKPAEGYFVTPILVNINLLVFILMAITGVGILAPGSEDLVKWGANFRPITLEGQWWRLLTCCFVHIGILHLLMNMYALVFIGLLLEPYLGKLKFAIAYLLTGIVASMSSLAWHDYTVSAGASGAIFGMYGVFLAMLTTNLIDKSTRGALLASIVVFVAYNLANGMKDGIDNAAHIGGLLSGLIMGYAFYPSLKHPQNNPIQWISVGIVAILTLVGTFWMYYQLPNDLPKYEERMKSFYSMEVMALKVYDLPKGTPPGKLLSAIKNKGIYYWNEDLRLLDEVDRMNLPDPLKKQNALLRIYCELRLKSYMLMYKKISEETPLYNDSLKLYDARIEAILEQLKKENR